MSQAELSYRIGFKSPTAVFYIEQGSRRLKVFDLVAIAKALGVSVDRLLRDHDAEISASELKTSSRLVSKMTLESPTKFDHYVTPGSVTTSE